MANEESDSVVPQKLSKNAKRKREACFSIFLGYGSAAKDILDQFNDVKTRLGLDTHAQTAEWILKRTAPLLVKEEQEKPKKKTEKKMTKT